jgi:sigma-B regulation protein RsbU (phosphoserine phosphatase)
MPTILYADDEQEHRMMMQVIMKNQGFELLEASNGHQAIEKIKKFLPDLVLLDLFMPMIDGFGVLKAISEDPLTQKIPVIILSAWPTGDNRERAKSFGAVDFIAKPYDPLQLVEVVQEHMPKQNIGGLASSPQKDTAPLSLP